MPANKRHTDYYKGVRSREDLKKRVAKWPALSEEDWLALEELLGARLKPELRMAVDRISAVLKVGEDLTRTATTVTAMRKKLKALRKAVLRYREDIWHSYRLQELTTLAKPIEEVEEFFFMKRFRIATKG
jgi:hypothetical protein